MSWDSRVRVIEKWKSYYTKVEVALKEITTSEVKVILKKG